MKSVGQVIILLALFSSCSPQTKQQYLKQYKEFVDEVTDNARHYTEADWQQANERYSLFNNQYYSRFKDELTLEDKLQVTGYRMQFNAAKAGVEIDRFYQQYLKNDLDNLRENLKHYVENQMEDDVARVLDEAKRISNELYRELKKLVDELREERK
ncbi:MAG: hypothetical protein RBT19_08800 [Tenuifilaceae bacterium]|jgi:hypothetical protein|nr:hypothetical protein [Tenuifilaceae bacterium]